MGNEDLIAYHSKRAMRELDLGLTAASTPAARAHLQLSSLHMDKLRQLTREPGLVRPPLVM